ncbi:polysaccharide pyruvyl transferase family protein [Luteimonas suaedae]|uniref:polysaccharide pyruvyl transferase family protein n=1 Tax=Luteimonas suaedae TaxID=2605430 RepID=UPI0011EE169E|nr:polysaccharide pyruvyl transferase family protein [Luteimonas suaedae]
MSKLHQLFYFSASTQFSNAGDALINRELLSLLRQYGELKVASAGAPASFLEEIRVKHDEIAFRGKWRLMASLLGSAILRGGCKHYLVLTPGDPPGGVSPGDIFRAALFPLLKLFGVRIIKIGASISRMDGLRLRLEAKLSRSMYFYGIRDAGSVSRARQYDFSSVEYCPDLAFNLPVNAKPSTQGQVLVSLREDNLDTEEIAQLHARVRALAETIGGSVCLESTTFISQVERDIEPMRRLSTIWRGSDAYARHASKIADLESAYSGTTFVVSNRLHVILLAASQGALPFCLAIGGKNRKITDLLHSVGLGGLIVDGGKPLMTLEQGRQELTRAFTEQRSLLHHVLAKELGI